MNAISLKPTAKVAIKKSILRVYEVDNTSTVYLKSGSEFEIELFNPLQETILCKFKLNGKSLNGEGLILYPGQRVFLERYLDDNKKFKFETYTVDDVAEVAFAIAKNGLLEVEFFKEQPVISVWNTISTPFYGGVYNSGTITPNTFYCGSGTTTANFCSTGNSSTDIGHNTTLTSTAFSGSLTTSNAINPIKEVKASTTRGFSKSLKKESIDNSWMQPEMEYSLDLKEKETGIINKGEKSDQRFTYLDMNFQSYAFYTTKVKILPESEKIYDDKDLKHRKYCPECGKKINHKDKFCSFCGYKL